MGTKEPDMAPGRARDVTVLGQDSPLGAEVCRMVTASGYRLRSAEFKTSALIIASELAVHQSDGGDCATTGCPCIVRENS